MSEVHGLRSDDAAGSEILRRETDLLDPDVRRSRERLEALLHPDFFEHGSSGRRWTRSAILEHLSATTPDRVGIEDFSVSLLAPDTALATFTTVREAGVPRRALRSSIWRRGDDGWRRLFHQGTPMAENKPDA